MSFFDWLPQVIQAGTTIFNAVDQSNSNNDAAEIYAQSQRDALAAKNAAQAQAQQVVQQQQALAAPAVARQQQIIARGDALTPVQQQQIADARRSTINALGASGLRGSGAATVAGVRDVEGRLGAQFTQQNRSAADSAASSLSGQYFSSGNNLANSLVQSGNNAGQAITNIGDTNAALPIANSKISGQAIGDIGGIIASELNAKGRPSAYNDTNRPSERYS